MGEKTLSAPLAVIQINGVSVGKIRNLTCTENIQRGEVQGLGSFKLEEVPPTLIRCTFSASSYSIDYSKFGTIQDPFWPQGQDYATVARTLLLNNTPVSIHLYRKVADRIDSASGLVVSDKLERFLIIQDAFLDSKSFNISEGTLAGKDLNGRYLTPIIP